MTRENLMPQVVETVLILQIGLLGKRKRMKKKHVVEERSESSKREEKRN